MPQKQEKSYEQLVKELSQKIESLKVKTDLKQLDLEHCYDVLRISVELSLIKDGPKVIYAADQILNSIDFFMSIIDKESARDEPVSLEIAIMAVRAAYEMGGWNQDRVADIRELLK